MLTDGKSLTIGMIGKVEGWSDERFAAEVVTRGTQKQGAGAWKTFRPSAPVSNSAALEKVVSFPQKIFKKKEKGRCSPRSPAISV